MKLNYIRKINHAAKYCGQAKQTAYDNKDYISTHFYKNEQRKLYLLKALYILHFEETGCLEKGEQLQDNTGTILESYTSVDSKYTFHSISSVQKKDEKLGLYNEPEHNNYEQAKFYLPYLKYLEKNLPEKYKKIYDILVEKNFYFDFFSKSVEQVEKLKELGVKGNIYKESGYENNIYYCNLFINNIQICSITVETDFEENEMILTDESGYLEYALYDPLNYEI